jgi:hypothetical protein
MRVARGVPPPRPQPDVNLFMQGPKLVADLDLGLTADLFTDARPGSAEAEVYRAYIPVP